MAESDSKRKKVLSQEEIQKIREQIRRQEHDVFLWRMVFDTTLKHGLRAGESMSLKRKHLDLSNEELRVEGAKGGKNRTIAIPSGFCPDLSKLARGKEDEDWLFPSPKSGHYSKRSFQTRIRDKWSMAAGLYSSDVTSNNILEEVPEVQRVTPHTLRHTFATQHLRNGTPIEKVSDMLGHDDVQTTYSEYSHLVTEDHRGFQNEVGL